MQTYSWQRALDERDEKLKSFMIELFEKEESEDEPDNPWLKTTGVCELISCSPATVGRLRDEGLLPCSKQLGTYYYLTSDVHKMMDDGRIPRRISRNFI